MQQLIIENPILNSPFEEPSRHFRFSGEGITDDVVEGRRRSEYFVPVPRPRKRAAQLPLQGDWIAGRLEPNHTVSQVREAVARWRRGGYLGASRTLLRLLEHCRQPDRKPHVVIRNTELLQQVAALRECVVATRPARGRSSSIASR